MSNEKRRKNYDYFKYFCTIADYAYEAAVSLQEKMSAFQVGSVSKWMDEVHTIEHAADTEKHKMLEYLAAEFIAPIEREDIMQLAHELDTIVDNIDDVMQRLYMFNITHVRPEAIAFASLIVKGCEAVRNVTAEFNNFKKSTTLIDRIIEVNTIESKGDELLVNCTRNLFSSDASAKEILMWSTIYDFLEQCLDACEDAADTIRIIIMKNS